MKVLKVFVALIVSFLLLCTQGLLMGAFACDRSFSAGSVTKAIQETNFTKEIYEQALAASDQDADKKVQSFLLQAMGTDTATNAIGQYASSAINSVLYGEQFSQFTLEDLNRLAEDSLNELSSQTGVAISDSQKEQVLKYVNKNGPEIVNEINNTLPVLEDDSTMGSSELAAISQVQTFLGTPIRIALCAVCLILGIILIALFWGSKLGYIWWAFVSFILGSVFLLLGTSSNMLSSYIQDTGEGTTFSLLLTGMFTRGFTFVGVASLVLMAVLIVLCLVGRSVSKRRAA
ncbi:hypothetical protein NE619_05620 [Anaerovorax odorimutans]|uniref:Uncharacterized protein n=1 Tax=Anaerovorax odorimutans TaxID=109327 RepID=A0ABT1RLX9_9FIRM|nr:hypothetical protein [Anaerovorax odorimutans]MCQ4636199.1 hypothetical protein [Anaerovorax odorimutans]